MRNVLRCLLLVLMVLLGMAGRMYAADASISVLGTEQQVSGNWDSGTITISFVDSLGDTFHEAIGYNQYSTAASIASAFGGMFSRDFLAKGLCAHAVGSVIYFHLADPAAFGSLSISGSTVSFQLNSSLWPVNSINSATALVCSPDNVTAGSATSCTASVPVSATGNIVFSVDGTTTFATVALTSGSATTPPGLLSSASLGSHIIGAAYSGDSTHATSSAFATITVNAAPGSLTSTTIYSYNILNPDGSSGYAGNGNITGYTDSVNGTWSGITYDSLNRLAGATQVPVGGSTQYFCWAYDSFGNRTLQSQAPAPFQSGSPNCQAASGVSPATVSASYPQPNNQISSFFSVPINCPPNSVTNTSSGYCYDAAGDVTDDGTNTYLYDDEGRVCAVMAPSLLAGWPATMMQYVYDAEDRRVAKGTITTFSCDNSINSSTGLPNNGFTLTNSYALGLGGEQVTETGGDGQWLHTNVFVGGQLLATYDDSGVHFHITDWLGSRRVQTNYLGQVEATYQNLPFGEMVPQYNSIFLGATEQHFTGKERDTESGNDYMFARYYNSASGRFLSPDWSAKEDPVPYAKLDNPQSLNLYSYVYNNPLGKADPDGHDGCGDGDGGCAAFRAPPIGPKEAQVDRGILEIAAAVMTGGVTADLAAAGRITATLVTAFAQIGSATAGTTRIVGVAAGGDPKEVGKAADAVSTVTNPVGYAVTVATKNIEKGGDAATISNAAKLASNPKEALKNPADSALTITDAFKLGKETASKFLNPSPPPSPKAPGRPDCSVAGACSK